ncbi:MAG TPA: hypothetical protein VFW98_18750 [Gemmatimonadaceae bacterium]|nr:hypothetical protein [Gemmatimonadaceae bacterium]
MTDPTVDARFLAALLDGRLSQDDRDEVLRRVAASPESFEALVEAVAIVRDVEGYTPRTSPVTPATTSPRRRWRSKSAVRWLSVAGAVAAAAVLLLIVQRSRRPSEGSAQRLAALLVSQGAVAPAGFDATPWAARRGSGGTLSTRARAVRLGARAVDLELAVHAQSTTAASIASAMAHELDAVPAASPVTTLYRNITRLAASDARATRVQLTSAEGSTARLVGTDAFEFGGWLQSARIAAAGRDRNFFASDVSGDAIRGARDRQLIDSTTHAALTQLRASAAVGDGADWGALAARLTDILRALAGG